MEKNTIVLDELGNEIGSTYPKRARGLVKNGRAEYVDDCTIRLKRAHAPTVMEEIMEEHKMSEILNFNARDFRIDRTYQNAGSRMFITDMFGENVEVYHLSDNTRIYSDKVLEGNREYLFRFAIVGDSNVPGEVSQCIIVPITGEELTEED